MNRLRTVFLLSLLAGLACLGSCGMTPEEREAYLASELTVTTSPPSARGDQRMLAWVRAESSGDPRLKRLRVTVFDDRDGDGRLGPGESTGIRKVALPTSGSEARVLTVHQVLFPADLAAPRLWCEMDTDEGTLTESLDLG